MKGTHCTRPARSTGFTLVEILIAMTILFSTLVSGLAAYQGALANSERAGQVMLLLARVAPVQQHIKQALAANPEQLAGAGNFGSVGFDWQAEIASFAAPPSRYDPDSGDFIQEPPRFLLLDIHLTMRYRERQRTFNYQELAWLAQTGN